MSSLTCNPCDEYGHQGGRDYGEVLGPPEDAARGNVEASPQQDLAKVVGMSAPGPQASVDKFALQGEKKTSQLFMSNSAF